MCGFLVFVSDTAVSSDVMHDVGRRLELLHHRGPDDTVLTRVDDNVVVGFKRLAVIDRRGSRQPLHYPPTGPQAGRWSIAFNGEVYNFERLRQDLRREHDAVFATDGDAEVVAAAYHYWGARALDRLRGMFAMALWDRATRTVHAIRDPFGIKPLYYLDTGDGLWLASEKRSLMDLAGDELDADAVSLYLTMQYAPEPHTMHRSIRRLPAASHLTRRPDTAPVIERYGRPTFRPDQGAEPDRLIAELREALRDSVRAHMRADVPVGAFLSSGVDSTAIVALASEINPRLHTFTAGFGAGAYSEIEIAQATAGHLGVNFVPTVVNPDQVIDALPHIIWHLDDPIADPSIVPAYFLAKSAAEHVTVVLSGEGADELFGGYRIYREPAAVAPIRRLPDPLQRALRRLSVLIPEGVKGKHYLQRATTPIEIRYFGNARVFTEQEKDRLIRGAGTHAAHSLVTSALYEEAAGLDDVAAMQHIDVNTWLPGDILTKADRMSMAHSLELRVPFLDRAVFDVAARIPTSLKVPARSRETKVALRRALRGIVPEFVIDRPKLGFPTPARQWLRGPLYDWAHDVLSTSGAGKLLDLDYGHALLAQQRSEHVDHSRKLWTLLTFCLWHAVVVERSITGLAPGHSSHQQHAASAASTWSCCSP